MRLTKNPRTPTLKSNADNDKPINEIKKSQGKKVEGTVTSQNPKKETSSSATFLDNLNCKG